MRVDRLGKAELAQRAEAVGVAPRRRSPPPRFAPLGAGELGLALAAGIAGILWIEGWKLYAGMRRSRAG